MRDDLPSLFDTAAVDALHRLEIAATESTLIHMSENVTFRISEAVTGRCYALRLHRPDYQSLATLKSERSWIRALAAGGFNVPAPVTNGLGEDLVCVSVPALGEHRWASANSWIEGTILGALLAEMGSSERAIPHFVDLGGLLAAMHNQSSAWTRPSDFVRHRLDAEGLMGPKPIWGEFWRYRLLSRAESDLLLRVRERIHAVLHRYGEDPSTFGLIHADLHPGNIIVQRGRLALIDFDDAAFGWHAFDIAVALVRYLGHPSFEAFFQACLSGYRSVREISDRDVRMIPMFLLARSMNQLGWFHLRPDIPEPEWLGGLKAWVCDQAAAFQEPL